MTNRDDISRFPAFFGIGAQKAGTTWLHRMLGLHPDLWLPPLKEIHFFDRVHSKAHSYQNGQISNLTRARSDAVARAKYWVARGHLTPEKMTERIRCLDIIGDAHLTDEWYASIFDFAPRGVLCGEITPEYALLPASGIDHMLRLQPAAKFIFIMRDPIDRSWSALRMEDRRRPLGRKARLRRISRPGFIAYSDYTTTISRFQEHVARDRLLLLFYDDIVDRPEELLRTACNFLGVDFRSAHFRGLSEKVHAGPEQDVEPELYDALRKALEPVYRRLLALGHPQIEQWCDKHYGPSW